MEYLIFVLIIQVLLLVAILTAVLLGSKGDKNQMVVQDDLSGLKGLKVTAKGCPVIPPTREQETVAAFEAMEQMETLYCSDPTRE